MTELKIRGLEMALYCNGAAALALAEIEERQREQLPEDERENAKNIIALVSAGPAAYKLVCEVTAILAEQGELVRRMSGHDARPIPKAGQLELLMYPADLPAMAGACIQAILAGYRVTEEDEPEETDPILEIFEKKTENR